jgi:pilus assembly protein CpaE
VLVKHDSGVDLLLAPPSPESVELVRPEHLPYIAERLRAHCDYIVIDIDKRLDDIDLGVFEVAETVFVVMTADLSCLKNVRVILETMNHLGYPASKIQLALNRSNAFTGIKVKNAEGALKRKIDHQVVNRGAISALNSRPVHVHESRLPARTVAAPVRPRGRQAGRLGRGGRPRALTGGWWATS